MEKMNLSFKIDGRELAKVIIKERLETVSRRCKCIKSILEDELESKIDFMADNEGNVIFNIYDNKYDYYSIYININKGRFEHNNREVVLYVTFMLENRIEELDFYKAPPVEKVIVDLLEENESEDIYIMDGLLIREGLEFCLKDIEEFHVYNGEECIMRIWDELDGWYVIDFINGTIEEESILSRGGIIIC